MMDRNYYDLIHPDFVGWHESTIWKYKNYSFKYQLCVGLYNRLYAYGSYRSSTVSIEIK